MTYTCKTTIQVFAISSEIVLKHFWETRT